MGSPEQASGRVAPWPSFLTIVKTLFVFCLGPPFIKKKKKVLWKRDSKGEKKFGLWDNCYQMLSVSVIQRKEKQKKRLAVKMGGEKWQCHFWVNFSTATALSTTLGRGEWGLTFSFLSKCTLPSKNKKLGKVNLPGHWAQFLICSQK